MEMTSVNATMRPSLPRISLCVDQQPVFMKKRTQRLESSTSTEVSDMISRALAFDAENGEFSGWLYVADGDRTKRSTSILSRLLHPRHRVRKLSFSRQFCRVNELVCSFYESEDAAQAYQPTRSHFIITVNRVPERNKTFMFTDYDDRRVFLHTAIYEDFDEWLGAFQAVIRRTHIAKRMHLGLFGRKHNSTGETDISSTGGCNAMDESRRVHTDALLLQVPTVPARVVPNDGDETVSAWFHLEQPWWKLTRRRSKRLFVLSESTISCFSVNKEGHPADFSHEISGCRYQPARKPLEAEIFPTSGGSIKIHAASHRGDTLERFMSCIRRATATSNKPQVASGKS